jgi:hypothetical protein
VTKQHDKKRRCPPVWFAGDERLELKVALSGGLDPGFGSGGMAKRFQRTEPLLPLHQGSVPRRRRRFAPGIDALEARVQLNGASGGVQIGVDQTTANLLYQDFMNNSQVPSGNSGNTAAGIAGTLSPRYLAAVQEMIDDLRWMAGDPGTITLDPTLNSDAQVAALIDSENDASIEDGLPNPPSVDYGQVTDLDATGGPALSYLMVDFGPENTFVGHRRSLLSPLDTTMGWGEAEAGSPAEPAAAVGFELETSTLPITAVAWPPPGAFPLPWLPDAATFGEPMRWSLQTDNPNVDFSQASVTVTQNGVPQAVTIDDAEATSQGSLGTALTWVLPSTATGEQAATYAVTISGILDANHQPLPDISYTTTTFVPTTTTATLTSQVEFLAPTNQTAFGSATSTVTLARSLNVAGPLSVTVQGNGVSQEVDFATGQAYATATLPAGSFTLTDPQGGVIAPDGGTTQVVPSSAGGGATSSVIFTGEMRYHPRSARKNRHPKVQFELTFSAPINQGADVNPHLYTALDTIAKKGKRRPARVVRIAISVASGPSSSSLLVTEKTSPPKGILTLTGAGLEDTDDLVIASFSASLR